MLLCVIANGFAFNGPDGSSLHSDDARELVTKRVNTFTDAMRVESTRLSAPIEVHHHEASTENETRTASMKPQSIAQDGS